jgi:hypothetical protein
MGLLLAQMMNGRKHGQHAPPHNREECICWPKKWLPEDLNNNVRILSLSYDSKIVASVHNDVIGIGKNLIQSLITNSRCDNLLYLWTH